MTQRIALRQATNVISFNGSSDYATIPITPTGAGWSFAFWIFIPTFNSSFGRVFSYADGSSNGIRSILNTNASRFVTFDSGNGSFLSSNGKAGGIIPGEWTHLVYTYNGTNGANYINGVLQTSTAQNFTVPTGQTFTIGRASTGATSFGKFLMKDFVYKPGTPFTETEITNLYYNGTVPSGVTCNISFNGTATDSSGNGNDATLNGTSYVTSLPSFAKARTSV